MKVDYLIVGQGIAGTLFAHECRKNGQRILVIDNGEHNASLTAAGMVNPVVLKRFTPVWQGQEQIENARKIIAELNTLLGENFDSHFDILRIFHDESECQTWQKKAETPSLYGLLDSQIYPLPDTILHAPFGVGKVNFSGSINLKKLLKYYRNDLHKHQQLRTGTVDYSRFHLKENVWQYDDISAKQVVFCEGYGMTANPFFNYLPLKGNKGEVLTIRVPNLRLSATVKGGVFLMPLPEQGDDVYLLGATYHWIDKNNLPTAAAKAELLEKLRKLLPTNLFHYVQILEHHAGIRPTVVDRRPLLGCHPDYANMWVLNGLGTRGVMLGASMAPLLYDHIVNGKVLPSTVDITRFVPEN